MSSPLDWIQAALEELNVIREGQAPSASQQVYCLGKLNRRLGQLSLVGRYVPYVRSQAFTIAASAQSYTVGPTGTFALTGSHVRPPRLRAVKLVRTAGTPDDEVTLELFNVDEYIAEALPAQSAAEPFRVYYQPTLPNGTLWPVPYPTNTANQLKLYFNAQLAAIAQADIAIAADVGLGYEEALVLDLAKAVHRHYGAELPDSLIRDLGMAWANIGSANTEIPYLEPVPSVGRLDFYTRGLR